MQHCDKGKHLLWKAGLTILHGKFVFVDKFSTNTSERKQKEGKKEGAKEEGGVMERKRKERE